jgi:hypothetical protein
MSAPQVPEARERRAVTDDQLTAWERVCERATPGPWSVLTGSSCKHVCSDNGQFQTGCIGFDGNGDSTATFIALAREAVPQLIAEVRRLRADAARVEWLGDLASDSSAIYVHGGQWCFNGAHYPSFRAAIDAAMEANGA